MPSSASTRLRLNLQASGENSNTWGSLLNSQVFQLIDDAIAGRTAFTLSGTKTLTSTNFVANEARAACLDITSGTGGTVTIPGYEKLYLVRNATSGDVILTTGGSTNATVKAGNVQFVMCNATDVYLAKERDLGSDLLTTSATPTADGHLTRKAYVDGLIATEQAARLTGDAATLATAEAYTDATSFAAGSLPGGGTTGQYVRQIAGPSADWHDPFPQVAGGAYDGKVLWSIGGATTWALPIPAQSGNSGKFLTTDGSAASWALPIPSQSGNAGKVLTTDGSSASWTSIGGATLTLFGDGSDGNVTVSGSVSLSRDMLYANLTLAAGAAISTNGYRIFVNGTLDLTAAPAGAIKNNGANGSAGTDSTSASPNAGGSGGAATPGATVGAAAAGATGGLGSDTSGTGGASGNAGQNGGPGGPGGSGGSGTGGSGGSGGGGGPVTAALPHLVRTSLTSSDQSTPLVTGGGGGGAGGGGCGDGGSTRDGGGGGGSGAAGGVVQIYARYISRSASTAAGAIQAKGGQGGKGGGVSSSQAGGGAGGAGGGGGYVAICCETVLGSTATGVVDVSGGKAGDGGNGFGAAGSGGKAGGYGGAGRFTFAQLFAATVTDSGVGSAGAVVNNSGLTGGVAATAPVTQYAI